VSKRTTWQRGDVVKVTPPRDVEVVNHGSICVVTGITEAGRQWLDDHTPEDATRWCGGVVVEPRYLDDLLCGMDEDGLRT
jgi:hypothetical protein